MKFYDFSDYEYYALIGVSERETFPMDVALEAYIEEVAEVDEEEKGILPKEVSKEQALEIYKKAVIEGCETEEEKIEQFKKEIDLNNKLSIRYGDNRYVLLLIDGELL